jgi:DNA-directed RNA polymerase subunit RPC12/RpoP
MTWPPDECPDCGSGVLEKRYTTGSGWRVDAYVCGDCGRRIRRSEVE